MATGIADFSAVRRAFGNRNYAIYTAGSSIALIGLWVQRLGLEWLYRLLRDPRRWRRMLALPFAAWLVFWQRFADDGSRNPAR